MPCVPKVKPKALSKYVFCSEALPKVTPFEISFETFFGLTSGKCHLSPSAERKTSPSGYFPSPPRVPEYPEPGESLRMTPELAICPRVPEP